MNNHKSDGNTFIALDAIRLARACLTCTCRQLQYCGLALGLLPQLAVLISVPVFAQHIASTTDLAAVQDAFVEQLERAEITYLKLMQGPPHSQVDPDVLENMLKALRPGERAIATSFAEILSYYTGKQYNAEAVLEQCKASFLLAGSAKRRNEGDVLVVDKDGMVARSQSMNRGGTRQITLGPRATSRLTAVGLDDFRRPIPRTWLQEGKLEFALNSIALRSENAEVTIEPRLGCGLHFVERREDGTRRRQTFQLFAQDAFAHADLLPFAKADLHYDKHGSVQRFSLTGILQANLNANLTEATFNVPANAGDTILVSSAGNGDRLFTADNSSEDVITDLPSERRNLQAAAALAGEDEYRRPVLLAINVAVLAILMLLVIFARRGDVQR